jgi:hypothetical protein
VIAGAAGCELELDPMLTVGWLEDGGSATLVDGFPVPLVAEGLLAALAMITIAIRTPAAQMLKLMPARRVGWDRRKPMARAQRDFGPSGGVGARSGGGGGTFGGTCDIDPSQRRAVDASG